MNVNDYKRCSKCKQLKLRSDFYASVNKPDGLQNECKQCHKEGKVSKQLTDNRQTKVPTLEETTKVVEISNFYLSAFLEAERAGFSSKESRLYARDETKNKFPANELLPTVWGRVGRLLRKNAKDKGINLAKYKKCSKCMKSKPVSEFYAGRSVCKECYLEQLRKNHYLKKQAQLAQIEAQILAKSTCDEPEQIQHRKEEPKKSDLQEKLINVVNFDANNNFQYTKEILIKFTLTLRNVRLRADNLSFYYSRIDGSELTDTDIDDAIRLRVVGKEKYSILSQEG